jgi:hypothetical protein
MVLSDSVRAAPTLGACGIEPMARYVFEQNVGPRYYIEGTTLYEHGTGKPALYVDGSTVYSYAEKKAVYWIDGNYLHPYDRSMPKLYFET